MEGQRRISHRPDKENKQSKLQQDGGSHVSISDREIMGMRVAVKQTVSMYMTSLSPRDHDQ